MQTPRTALSLNYRFLLRMAVLMGVSTAVVSFLFLKALGHHTDTVALWGKVSMATDLLFFSVVSSAGLGLLATHLTRLALQDRKVMPLHWHLKSQTLIDRLPTHTLHRAFMLGLAGAMQATIMLYLLELRNLQTLPYQAYTLLFVLHATALSVAITVMSVYRALGDRIEKHAVVG